MGRSDDFYRPQLIGYEVSCLFLVFVGITLSWEVVLGLLTFINNVLRGKRASWLDRVKEEVLALGVVSLVLLFLEPVLERVCEPNGDDPNELDALDLLDLSSIPGADYKCPPGYRNVFPASIIHAAHYLLFYLAVVHIIFNMITNSITSRKFAFMVGMERVARNAEVEWEQEQMASHQRGEEPEQVLLAEVDSDDDGYVQPGKPKKAKKPGFVPYIWRRVKRTWHLLAHSVDQRSFSILRKVCQLRFEAHAMDNNVRSFSYINIASQVLEADLEQVYAHAWLMILFMTGLMLYPKLLYQVVWANLLCLLVLVIMSVKMSYILRDTVEVCRLALKKGCEKQKHLRREEVLMKMAGMMSDCGNAPYVRAPTFMPTEKSFKSRSSAESANGAGQPEAPGPDSLYRSSKDNSRRGTPRQNALTPTAEQAAAERQMSLRRVSQWQDSDDNQAPALPGMDWTIQSAPDSPSKTSGQGEGSSHGYPACPPSPPRPPYLFKNAVPKAVSMRRIASLQRPSRPSRLQAEQQPQSVQEGVPAMLEALNGTADSSSSGGVRPSASQTSAVRPSAARGSASRMSDKPLAVNSVGMPDSNSGSPRQPGSINGAVRQLGSNNGAARQSTSSDMAARQPGSNNGSVRHSGSNSHAQNQPALNGGMLQQPGMNMGMLGQPGMNMGMLGQPGMNMAMMGQPGMNMGMLGQPGMNMAMMGQPGMSTGMQGQQMSMPQNFNPWLLQAQLMAMAGGSFNMMGVPNMGMMNPAALSSLQSSPAASGGGARQQPPMPPAAPNPPQPAPPPLPNQASAASLQQPQIPLDVLSKLGDADLIQRAMANLGWGSGTAIPAGLQQAFWQTNQLYGTNPSQPGADTSGNYRHSRESAEEAAPEPCVIEDPPPKPSAAEASTEDEWWQALEKLQVELELIQQKLAIDPDSPQHQQRLLQLQAELEQLTQQLSAIDTEEPSPAGDVVAQHQTAASPQPGEPQLQLHLSPDSHVQPLAQQPVLPAQEVSPEVAYAQLQLQQLQMLQYLQAFPHGLTADQVQYLLASGSSGRLAGPGPVQASLPAWGASLMAEEVRTSMNRNRSLKLGNSFKQQEERASRRWQMSPIGPDAVAAQAEVARLASKTFNLTEPEARAQVALDAKRAMERAKKKKKRQHLEMHEPHLPFRTQAMLAEEVEKKVKQLFWLRHPHVLLWFVNFIFLITSLSITSAVAFVIPYNKFQKLASLGHDYDVWSPVIVIDILMATYMCWYVLPLYALITTAGTSFPPRVIEEVRAAKTMSPEDHHGISGMVLAALDHIFVGVEHNERRASLDLATYFVAALADHAGIVLSPQLRSSASKGALEIMANPGVRNVLREFAQFWHDVAWYGPPEEDYVLQADTTFMRTAFAQLDADGSGALSFSELAQMVRALGALATAGDIETMLWEVDLDGSRSVGFDEFTKFLVYAFFDVDTNGYVGLDELEESMKKLGMAPESPEFCAQLMAAADHNSDGRINMREFFMLFEKLQVDEEDDDEEEEGSGGDDDDAGGSKKYHKAGGAQSQFGGAAVAG